MIRHLSNVASLLLAAFLVTGCNGGGKVGASCKEHTDCGEGLVCGTDKKCRSAVAGATGPSGASAASGAPSGATSGGAATSNIPAVIPFCYPEALCDTGDFDGCTKLCDQGKAEACRLLWKWYGFDPSLAAQHDEAKTKQYQEKQVKLDEAACKAKEPCACNRLFENHSKGQGVKRDAEAAVERATHGCELGDPGMCESLGDVYLNGFPVDVGKDPAKATRFYERSFALRNRGCEAENFAHCAFLGRMYLEGIGVKPSADRAISLTRRACEGGEGLGCSFLGLWYRQGRPGIPKNPRAAHEAYERACKQGRKEFCAEVKAVEAESPGG